MIVLLLLLLQTWPQLLSGQGKNSNRGQAPIRVSSRLVQVDAIVTDSKGLPITDLTQKDFRIYDSGKEQKVSLMEIADARSLPAPVRANRVPVFSNRITFETSSRAPTLYVVLFDGLNTQVTDQAYARENISRFLRTVRPEDLVAIYVLGSSLRIAHDFTSDVTALHKAAEKLSSATNLFDPTSPDTAPAPEAAFAEFAAISEKRYEAQMTQNRVQFTLDALEAIAHRLDSVQGRKNLLWVSASFPLGVGFQTPDTTYARFDLQRSFTEQVNRAMRHLNEANIAVYPIDSRGLIAPYQNKSRLPQEAAEGGPLTQIRRGGGRTPASNSTSSSGLTADSAAPLNQTPNPFATQELDNTQLTMRLMADLTSGRAFYNTNDLAGALQEAMHDGQFSYVLGYYPAHDSWDGKFHELKVEVRRPGVRVRFRQGYFATPETAVDSSAAQTALAAASKVPLVASGVGLEARFEKNPQPDFTCLMRLRVDARDVSLVKEGDTYKGAVDLLIQLIDSSGAQLWSDSQRVSLTLKPETYGRIQKAGLEFKIQVPEKSGSTQLRAAVQDASTGKFGTLRIALNDIQKAVAPQ